jgi:hypothetical protein
MKDYPSPSLFPAVSLLLLRVTDVKRQRPHLIVLSDHSGNRERRERKKERERERNEVDEENLSSV